jgi:hypothetical protein
MPEQEPTTKVIAATKPSLISTAVAVQATTRKPHIAYRAPANHDAVHVQPMKGVNEPKVFKTAP